MLEMLVHFVRRLVEQRVDKARQREEEKCFHQQAFLALFLFYFKNELCLVGRPSFQRGRVSKSPPSFLSSSVQVPPFLLPSGSWSAVIACAVAGRQAGKRAAAVAPWPRQARGKGPRHGLLKFYFSVY